MTSQRFDSLRIRLAQVLWRLAYRVDAPDRRRAYKLVQMKAVLSWSSHEGGDDA